jgi:protocatechuate 3,4-dioxygenase, beta subunit
MSEDLLLTRRQLLAISLALSGVVLTEPFSKVLAQPARKPTEDQVMGPFYPVTKPIDQDADLTVIQGRPGKAQGKVMHLTGRVLNLKGEPIRGTAIEIWQANTFGRYAHPGDTHDAPLDPNFQGYGTTTTDAEGRYRFKTVKPGSYPVSGDWIRPPHIHFDVTSRSNKLITQMYFEGEPLNEKDLFFKSALYKESLITKLTPFPKDVEPDTFIAVWDIVLPQM